MAIVYITATARRRLAELSDRVGVLLLDGQRTSSSLMTCDKPTRILGLVANDGRRSRPLSGPFQIKSAMAAPGRPRLRAEDR